MSVFSALIEIVVRRPFDYADEGVVSSYTRRCNPKLIQPISILIDGTKKSPRPAAPRLDRPGMSADGVQTSLK